MNENEGKMKESEGKWRKIKENEGKWRKMKENEGKLRKMKENLWKRMKTDVNEEEYHILSILKITSKEE